jgi:hypothetical protein
MLQDDNTASQVFELYGPKNYSMAEIAELVDREILKHRRHINVPKVILKPVAGLLNKLLWWPVISADEVEREYIDQKIDPKAKTFKDLGIEPAELSSLTFHYLVSVDRHIRVSWTHTNSLIAKLSEFCILRPTTSDRKGETRREEVFTCS